MEGRVIEEEEDRQRKRKDAETIGGQRGRQRIKLCGKKTDGAAAGEERKRKEKGLTGR